MDPFYAGVDISIHQVAILNNLGLDIDRTISRFLFCFAVFRTTQ